MDEFDELLMRTVERTLTYVFGDINARIILDYLEKNDCSLKQIPVKPDLFSAELRNIIGTGRGKLLGAACILEETILETLCDEIKTKLDKSDGKSFADQIKSLKESYSKRTSTGSLLTQMMSPESGDENAVRRKHRSFCNQ
jgi:hypothetical protein